MELSKYIDHTMLAADTTADSITKLVSEALEYNFKSVCVNSCWVSFCKKAIAGRDVGVCSVVGFPLGAMSTQAKAFETKQAVSDGADEIDMVINIGWLKDCRYDLVENDIREVKKACGDKILKVIIECCCLTDEEKVKACELSVKAGADFVKTSTGFSKGGATAEDVALMKRTVGDKAKVKAAGGIRDYDTAMKMIASGADRLGCSAGVKIIETAK